MTVPIVLKIEIGRVSVKEVVLVKDEYCQTSYFDIAHYDSKLFIFVIFLN